MDPELQPQLVEVILRLAAPLLALLAPLVLWYLNQRGVARKARELEILLKRLELVDKLQSLRQSAGGTSDSFQTSLDAELEAVVGDLAELRQEEQPKAPKTVQAGGATPAQRSWLRRALLLYEQASFKGSIFKGCFYFFSFIAVYGAVFLAIAETELGISGLQTALYSVSIFAFYFAIALLFRRAAVRDYQKNMRRLQSASV